MNSIFVTRRSVKHAVRKGGSLKIDPGRPRTFFEPGKITELEWPIHRLPQNANIILCSETEPHERIIILRNPENTRNGHVSSVLLYRTLVTKSHELELEVIN